VREQIEAILREFRPMIQSDGGDIELVEVTEEGTVKVRWIGICGTCSETGPALDKGLERLLKEQIPGVQRVISLETQGS